MFCSSRSPSDVPKEVYECCSLFFQLMDSFLFDIEVKTAQLKDAGMQSVQSSSAEQMWDTETEEEEAGGLMESGGEGTEVMEGDQTDADYLAQVDLEGLREIRSLSIPADWISSEIMEDESNLLQLLSDTIKVHKYLCTSHLRLNLCVALQQQSVSPWQEHCEGKKDLESFVRNVEEFAESLYTIIADRAGKRIHIFFTDAVSCLVWHVLDVIHCIRSTVCSLCAVVAMSCCWYSSAYTVHWH